MRDLLEGDVIAFPKKRTDPIDDFDELDDLVRQLGDERKLRYKLDLEKRFARGRKVDYRGRRAEIIRSGPRLALRFRDGRTEIVRRDSPHLHTLLSSD